MKHLVILVILMSYAAWGKTIDLRDWEPEFKYKSEELYTRDEAESYCKNKKQCVIRYEKKSRDVRIYSKVTNCKPILSGKLDSYISDAYHIRELIELCGDEKIYEAKKIEVYEQPIHYVWKIQKKIKYRGVKFIENK